MDRKKALSHIENLYGLSTEHVMQAIEKLGDAALSDEAIIHIAQRQCKAEEARSAWFERVADYRNSHPGLSWETCEQNVWHGVR